MALDGADAVVLSDRRQFSHRVQAMASAQQIEDAPTPLLPQPLPAGTGKIASSKTRRNGSY